MSIIVGAIDVGTNRKECKTKAQQRLSLIVVVGRSRGGRPVAGSVREAGSRQLEVEVDGVAGCGLGPAGLGGRVGAPPLSTASSSWQRLRLFV